MTEQKKRRGRPKKENLFQESQENKTTPKPTPKVEENDIPDTFQDEDSDLKSFMGKNKNKIKLDDKVEDTETNSGEEEIDEEMLREIEEFEKQEGLNDIPENDYNPLEESVKERGYTGGMNNPQNVQQQFQNERIIDEPNYQSNQSVRPDVDSKLFNGDAGNNGMPTNDSGSNQSGGNSGQGNEPPKTKKVTQDDINKTADVILLAYKNYAGVPFIYFSQYDIKKLEKLENDNEIDLETQVKRDGTTFRDYALDFNKEVEKAFEVTEEEVESLRTPLIDVLNEQEFSLTPTQRLLLAVGQTLVGKGMMCVKFLRQKKSDINEMKEMHAEKMEELRRQSEIINNQRQREEDKQQKQENQRKANQSNVSTSKTDNNNMRVVKEDEENTNENSENESETYVEFEEKPSVQNIEITPTLEDALNLDDEYNDIEDNDIPDA